MSRDRSLDEFFDETTESDEADSSDAGDANAPSDASDADTAGDTGDADTASDASDAGARSGAGDVTEETEASETESAADTESTVTVELPDPDDLAPLRPTFSVDPEGTCSRCGAAVTTRWWDDTGDPDTAGDAVDAGAGYVCADCKEW